MNDILVKRFTDNTDTIKKELSVKHISDYCELVKLVVQNITTKDYEECALDPTRIYEINDGDYQGTLVYVIAEKGYQPSAYWYVRVYYGSCSGCDTLQAICGYDDKQPTQEQVDDYWKLALHIVQGLKKMGGDPE
jgi:hypothetical protein